MSHAHTADKLLIKPATGARPAPPRTLQTDHSQGTHKAARHLTSHTPHNDNQADDRPRQTDPPSLTDP